MDDAITDSKNRGGNREPFLPNFAAIYSVFVVVVTAELLAIVLALADSGGPHGFVRNLSLYSLCVQWIALAGSGLLYLLRSRSGSWSDLAVGLTAWVLLLLLTLITSWLAIKFLGVLREPGSQLFFVLRNLAICAIVAALVLRYLYLQHVWRLQAAAESQARFQALQSRIRPHFLFNSMNTIASLTRSDPEMAEEVVHNLSDLFRANLSDSKTLSTLSEELALARGYLQIEGQRLGGRLQVEWDLQDLPQEAVMPSLLLQPLLENAIYHGIEPATDGGTIKIMGCYKRFKVNLSIRNTLPPEEHSSHRDGNSLALENIRQRLHAVFAGEAGLNMSMVDGEYQVRIFFPHPWRA
jgi:two-component system sensor histidine kinase AlgZ